MSHPASIDLPLAERVRSVGGGKWREPLSESAAARAIRMPPQRPCGLPSAKERTHAGHGACPRLDKTHRRSCWRALQRQASDLGRVSSPSCGACFLFSRTRRDAWSASAERRGRLTAAGGASFGACERLGRQRFRSHHRQHERRVFCSHQPDDGPVILPESLLVHCALARVCMLRRSRRPPLHRRPALVRLPVLLTRQGVFSAGHRGRFDEQAA